MKSKSAHVAIADRIRSQIESGELKPGHRFPPTKELARQWNTYPLAVHNAFRVLATAGLVERLYRQGTFVSRSSPVLGSVAIYLATDIMAGEHLKFYRAVYAEVVRRLKTEGVRADTLLDPRGDDYAHIPWPQLVKALEHREYQGVIVICADAPRMAWLTRLPASIVSGRDLATPIPDFAETALRCLAEKDCRRVGTITAFGDDPYGFFAVLRAAVAKLGLDSRPEWQMRPLEVVAVPAIERYGYDQFIALWKHETHPDGLIVYPDNLVPGVLAAMQRLQVRAPEDLQLALHKNKEIDLFCPFPATFIVNSAAEFAVGLIEQLRKKLTGASPLPVKLSVSTEENDSR